jgi:hypothetical protein
VIPDFLLPLSFLSSYFSESSSLSLEYGAEMPKGCREQIELGFVFLTLFVYPLHSEARFLLWFGFLNALLFT